MISGLQVTNVPRIFDESVLKTAARSKERASRFTGKSDGVQCAFHTRVRACGHAPYAVEIAELQRCIGDRRRMDPHPFDGVSGARGQAKRFGNGLVGDYGRVVIADERHAKVGRHAHRLTPSQDNGFSEYGNGVDLALRFTPKSPALEEPSRTGHPKFDQKARATRPAPDFDDEIAMGRVRDSLDGGARIMFEWVLSGRERHCVGGISSYCREKLGMSDSDISAARMKIVEAMHSNGLALDYPPPKVRTPRRMTSVERLMWLDRLRDKYTTVEDAAAGEGCTRNAINHHCRKLHGVSFPEWVRERQAA